MLPIPYLLPRGAVLISASVPVSLCLLIPVQRWSQVPKKHFPSVRDSTGWSENRPGQTAPWSCYEGNATGVMKRTGRITVGIGWDYGEDGERI